MDCSFVVPFVIAAAFASPLLFFGCQCGDPHAFHVSPGCGNGVRLVVCHVDLGDTGRSHPIVVDPPFTSRAIGSLTLSTVLANFAYKMRAPMTQSQALRLAGVWALIMMVGCSASLVEATSGDIVRGAIWLLGGIIGAYCSAYDTFHARSSVGSPRQVQGVTPAGIFKPDNLPRDFREVGHFGREIQTSALCGSCGGMVR